MTRPRTNLGSMVTTPRTEAMVSLLGARLTHESVAISRDEYRAIQRVYGFVEEQAPPAAAPPEAPPREAFPEDWQYREAVKQHAAAMREHEARTTPAAMEALRQFQQAGADRNAVRHAAADGLRLLAWLARYVDAGEDPLRTLVQLAVDAGLDVDPEDVEWSEG